MKLVLPFFLIFPVSLALAVDWTPFKTTTQADGIYIDRTTFVSGPDKYCMTIPVDTKVTKNGNSLELLFSEFGSSMIVFSNSPLKSQLPLTNESAEDYLRLVKSKLPPDAQLTGEIKSTVDPLPFGMWKTHQFLAEYTLFGEQKIMTIIVIDLESGEQILVRLTCSAKHLEPMQRQQIVLLNSWFKLEDYHIRPLP